MNELNVLVKHDSYICKGKWGMFSRSTSWGNEFLGELAPNRVVNGNLFCCPTNSSSYFRKACLFLKLYPLKKMRSLKSR